MHTCTHPHSLTLTCTHTDTHTPPGFPALGSRCGDASTEPSSQGRMYGLAGPPHTLFPIFVSSSLSVLLSSPSYIIHKNPPQPNHPTISALSVSPYIQSSLPLPPFRTGSHRSPSAFVLPSPLLLCPPFAILHHFPDCTIRHCLFLVSSSAGTFPCVLSSHNNLPCTITYKCLLFKAEMYLMFLFFPQFSYLMIVMHLKRRFTVRTSTSL